MKITPFFCLMMALAGCKTGKNEAVAPQNTGFGQPVKVEVLGYGGNLMEPFLTRDGAALLFNNLNEAPENTNLHWARRINDTTFQYQGEMSGINTPDLEGVPTLDGTGTLYFVSTRSYASSLSTIHSARFAGGVATAVQLVPGLSRLEAGWVNFDVEVSADGNWLYFVDGRLNQAGAVQSADLVVAQKSAAGFARLANSDALLKTVNTAALEYAACISTDGLALYFTRVPLPLTPTSAPEQLVATRTQPTDAFGEPQRIASITGFAEAATVSADGRTLYFHRKDGNKFALYLVRKN